jgi:hypothetical protein
MSVPHRFQWELAAVMGISIPFDGMPFVIEGTARLDCQNGPDHKKRTHLSVKVY